MTEREQFERWVADNIPDWELYRRDVKGSTRFGEYCKRAVQDGWLIWQASRRAALEEVAAWIEPQRNDVAAHGFEFAAAIRALAKGGK